MAKAGASSGLGSGVGGGPPADPRRSSSAARPETSLSGTCGGSRWMRRRQNRKEEKRGRNKGTRLTVVRNKERIAESLGHGTDSVFRWFFVAGKVQIQTLTSAASLVFLRSELPGSWVGYFRPFRWKITPCESHQIGRCGRYGLKINGDECDECAKFD